MITEGSAQFVAVLEIQASCFLIVSATAILVEVPISSPSFVWPPVCRTILSGSVPETTIMLSVPVPVAWFFGETVLLAFRSCRAAVFASVAVMIVRARAPSVNVMFVNRIMLIVPMVVMYFPSCSIQFAWSTPDLRALPTPPVAKQQTVRSLNDFSQTAKLFMLAAVLKKARLSSGIPRTFGKFSLNAS